jgi:hypothetical protein
MRREYSINLPIELPNKLFCLDFEDTVNNTNLKVTDTVNGITLTKASAGSVVFIDDPDFGRCLKTNNREATNIYSANWATIYPTIFGSSASTWAQRPLTWIMFNNSVARNDTRGGLLTIYNVCRISGYQGYNGSLSFVAANWIGIDMQSNKTKYPEKTANTDIGMYVMGTNYSQLKRVCSKEEVGFSSLSVLSNAYTPTSTTSGTLWFLCSQESSYYWPAEGIVAGITLYDGLLTNEQVAYIFNNKII